MSRKRVLFLCTGNSARSQMAEGLVNHYVRDQWEAFSAGTSPAGCVHPLAIQVMAELGIDISSQRSKPVAGFRDSSFDLVITLCDNAAHACPAWLGQGKVVHKGLPDPARVAGGEAEQLRAFRRVRDQIRELVLSELHDGTQLPDVPLRAAEGENTGQEQTRQDLTFWAHVIESAHDDKTRSVALAGYQFAALQLAFGRL